MKLRLYMMVAVGAALLAALPASVSAQTPTETPTASPTSSTPTVPPGGTSTPLPAVTATPAASSTPATAPTLSITSPLDNATVSNPVSITIASTGPVIKPATDNDPASAHYHVFVDGTPITTPGAAIPLTNPNIIHTASASVPLPNLTPGTHTVTVVLGRYDHTVYNPLTTDAVTFTVGAAVTAPNTGTGGGSATAPMPALVVLGALMIGVLAAATGAAVRRRA